MPLVKKKPPAVERKVVYPKRSFKECSHERGCPLTIAQAKAYLGWEEVSPETPGICLEIKAICGLNVLLNNNTANRPIYTSQLLTLRQEHLNGRWRLNGEAIVIGRTGQIISGQHRLISFILAEIERKKQPHWEEYWTREMTMESDLRLGIAEDDDIYNSVNCGKPSSPGDCLYRSPLLANLEPAERKLVSNAAGRATAFLWRRLGIADDAFCGKMTPNEEMDFIHRHPKVLDAVKFTLRENRNNE